MKDLYELAKKNLTLILKSPEQCLHSNQFESVEGGLLQNTEELIEHLVKMELIETETNNKIYFLQPETYSLIENDGLESFINNYLNPTSSNLKIEEEIIEEEVYDYTDAEVTSQRRKMYLIAFFVLIGIFFVTIYFSTYIRKNKTESIDNKILEKIDSSSEVKRIQKKIDSVIIEKQINEQK